MKVALPYSRDRRYLTGVDWVIGTLDDLTRRATGVGNLSQVILELDAVIAAEDLRRVLGQIALRFPLAHGRVARDLLNWAPYWRVPRPAEVWEFAIREVRLPDDVAAEELFAQHVNTPLIRPDEHVRFLLVQHGGVRSSVGMVFDHRLLDAYGAEAFLQLIQEAWCGRLAAIAEEVRTTEPAHLDEWERQFRGGQTINRFRIELGQRAVAALPLPSGKGPRPARFVHAALSPEQSTAFLALAGQESGMPLLLPSAIARAVGALDAVFARSPLQGDAYLVAVSVDARPLGAKWERLFFNHLSFLAFTLPVAAARHVAQDVMELREQFFAQMRDGVPGALQEATMLTRVCPLGVASRVARRQFQGRGCSFYLACLRESAYGEESFLGVRVRNLRHTPRVPPPPGLGLCLTWFGGRLNLVLSYLDGVLDEATAHAVLERLTASLVAAPGAG